jgi:hypothetical protein
MSLDNLPFNWFDLVLVVTLLAGVHRGRKRGMSEELLTFVMWLLILAGCAVAYEPLGRALVSVFAMFSTLFGFIVAYLAVGVAVAGIFTLVKRSLGGKLLGSDFFGGSEYYLGMGAGMVRFGCMLLAGLALLNARYFNPAEVKAIATYQKDVYGSDFFPTLHTMQQEVFVNSLTGPLIRNHLGFLLIEPTAPENKQFKQKQYELP